MNKSAMEFDPEQIEALLADCGRRCCICGVLHRVQVHHIKPKNQGGTNEIDNGIPLCPNCHDEVHSVYAPGRTTRVYTDGELRLHRQRTIEQLQREGKWTPGSIDWGKDKELIVFFAQCLDRSAFRTYFHQELSYLAFDRAMEDTLLALNTGYWRTRDNVVIERSRGKSCIVNPEWRRKLEDIGRIVEGIRSRFSEALGLNRMLYEYGRYGHSGHPEELEDRMDSFRHDRDLGDWMDAERQKTIDIMNSLLEEVGLQPLRGLHTNS